MTKYEISQDEPWIQRFRTTDAIPTEEELAHINASLSEDYTMDSDGNIYYVGRYNTNPPGLV